MILLNLPEEILLKIFQEVDTVTLFNLYNTCNRTRYIVQMLRFVETCNLSHNILASAHVLNLEFMKTISPFIRELNLSSVGNLSKTILVSAARRLKSLQTIDLGYTNITICDFLDVYQHCPTLKNVTINFEFDKKLGKTQFPPKSLSLCQDVFKNFNSVHFIGSQNNLIYNKLPSLILKHAKDIVLQYTILYNNKISYYVNHVSENVSISFKKFYVYFSFNTWKFARTNFLCETPFLNEANLNSCECIFILKSNPLTTDYLEVYCSPIFMEFFLNYFDIDAIPVKEYKRSTVHNAMFLFWRKDKTVFDDNFYKKLNICLKSYIPYCFESNTEDPAPTNYDWFQTSCMPPPDVITSENVHTLEPTYKKARIGQTNTLIDYDHVFKDKEKIELSIGFYGLKLNARTLSSTSTFLSKLTYLNLKGKVQYSKEFFNVLFRCCDRLETFDFNSPALSFIQSAARSLPLSKSVKNIRFVGKEMDFQTLISSFSQCSVLENVHLIDLSQNANDLTDPLIMFEKCTNLYCFHIYAEISDNKRLKQMQLLKKAKVKAQKPHISVLIINSEHYSLENNPFVEVFKFVLTKPFGM